MTTTDNKKPVRLKKDGTPWGKRKAKPKTKKPLSPNQNNKGQFVKGNKASNGRIGNKSQSLYEALEAVEKEKDESFLQNYIKRAFSSDSMAVALIRKLVPDLSAVEAKVDATVDGKITVTQTLNGEQ